MKVIFVNVKAKTRSIKTMKPVYIAIKSFCDYGQVYKVVTANKCVIVFCK